MSEHRKQESRPMPRRIVAVNTEPIVLSADDADDGMIVIPHGVGKFVHRLYCDGCDKPTLTRLRQKCPKCGHENDGDDGFKPGWNNKT